MSFDTVPAPEPLRLYKTDEGTRLVAKTRRKELTAAGLCINARSHGKATHGVRCKRCDDVHKGGEPPVRVARTHCKRGHEYNVHTAVVRRSGHIDCRVCRRVRDAAKRSM